MEEQLTVSWQFAEDNHIISGIVVNLNVRGQALSCHPSGCFRKPDGAQPPGMSHGT
jgi:hypothetical protein